MKKTLIAAALGLLIGATANAEMTLKDAAEAKLVAAFGPDLKVREVAQLAKGQILEVVLIDGSVMHMTPDLSYFTYRDELYELTARGAKSVTESRQEPMRAASLAAVPDRDTVVFPAKGEQKAMINVFTDIDCGYCQKLHIEIPRLNELGIKVRYLAYPRAGIKDRETGQLTPSFEKINYVWCQTDRGSAMTDMKATQRALNITGQRLSQASSPDQAGTLEGEYRALQSQMMGMLASSKDCHSPIAVQYELGQSVGVTGTPAIVTEEGSLIPGYMPADELAKRLGVL
ncbi:DsbC family protein [Thalassolituus sp.]|jgi:thiol:disulfide interchange protein DsbC|uniref:DsbC family protein n=1 Tax=Thalassolituus sp. TaxID=2030822 RepID=UPI002A83CE62|nr:DsbC family protein [Thalassolituus sp.]